SSRAYDSTHFPYTTLFRSIRVVDILKLFRTHFGEFLSSIYTLQELYIQLIFHDKKFLVRLLEWFCLLLGQRRRRLFSPRHHPLLDRKSTQLNSSYFSIFYV